MKTKLSETKLTAICQDNGLAATRENMALAIAAPDIPLARRRQARGQARIRLEPAVHLGLVPHD